MLQFVYFYLNVCCSVGIKMPLTVDPHDTKKSASLSESCFVCVAAVILDADGWIRAADERRFCQNAPRAALLRICLQDNTEGSKKAPFYCDIRFSTCQWHHWLPVYSTTVSTVTTCSWHHWWCHWFYLWMTSLPIPVDDVTECICWWLHWPLHVNDVTDSTWLWHHCFYLTKMCD